MKIKTNENPYRFFQEMGLRSEMITVPRSRKFNFTLRTALDYYHGPVFVARVFSHPKCRQAKHTIFYSNYGKNLIASKKPEMILT